MQRSQSTAKCKYCIWVHNVEGHMWFTLRVCLPQWNPLGWREELQFWGGNFSPKLIHHKHRWSPIVARGWELFQDLPMTLGVLIMVVSTPKRFASLGTFGKAAGDDLSESPTFSRVMMSRKGPTGMSRYSTRVSWQHHSNLNRRRLG